MKISLKFNNLENMRYDITYVHNATQKTQWGIVGAAKTEMDQTFTQLIERHRARIGASSPSPSSHAFQGETQVFRNHRSTLNSFLLFLGKCESNRVGAELLAHFETRSREYLTQWTNNPKSRSDRQSHLRAWHQTALDANNEHSPTKERPFHAELRLCLAQQDRAPKTIAREAGISTSAMQRWVAGAHPNTTGLPSLRRLENALGLARGHLESLLPGAYFNKDVIPPPAISFRERIQRQAYGMPLSHLSPQWLDEWKEFVDYKTCISPYLKRTASWRLLPSADLISAPNPICMVDGLGCESANFAFKRLRYFFGFLCLSKTAPPGWAEQQKEQQTKAAAKLAKAPVWRCGLGLAVDQIQTLAVLANPRYVDAYLRFMKSGSGGVIHGGHRAFAALVSELTRSETGYLWQQPQLAGRLSPEILGQQDWHSLCAAAHKLANEWKKVAKSISRDPDEPLRPLLDLKEPLLPLFRAIKHLDKLAAEAAPGSRSQAEHKRNALLVMLLVSNPLRIRTLSLIRWREDNSGNLYKHSDGHWHLRLTGNSFKNDEGSLLSDYDSQLGLDELAARIEEYVTEYRPALIKNQPHSDWLFPSGKTGGKHPTLNVLFRKITQLHIPEVQSFGPHGVRHLVATYFLNKSPNNFRGVAQLLHDRLETVLKRYDREKMDKAFNQHSVYLAELAATANH
jgi:integrase